MKIDADLRSLLRTIADCGATKPKGFATPTSMRFDLFLNDIESAETVRAAVEAVRDRFGACRVVETPEDAATPTEAFILSLAIYGGAQYPAHLFGSWTPTAGSAAAFLSQWMTMETEELTQLSLMRASVAAHSFSGGEFCRSLEENITSMVGDFERLRGEEFALKLMVSAFDAWASGEIRGGVNPFTFAILLLFPDADREEVETVSQESYQTLYEELREKALNDEN